MPTTLEKVKVASTRQANAGETEEFGAFFGVRDVLLPFFASRLLCMFTAWMGQLNLIWKNTEGFDPGKHPLVSWIFRWDSGWYSSVIDQGYFFVPGQPSNVAFFPLYPKLVEGLMWVTNSKFWSAFTISHLSLFFALIFVYRIAHAMLNDVASAKRVIWFVCFFPTAYYFSAFYSESLFLLMVAAAYWFASRRQWFLAALFAAGASGTRFVGLLMWGVVGLEWLRVHGWSFQGILQRDAWKGLLRGVRTDWKSAAIIQIAPLGFVAYATFLHLKFGDALAFLHVQKAWGRGMQSPLTTAWEALTRIFEWGTWEAGPTPYFPVMASIDLMVFVLALISGIYLFVRINEGLGLFVLLGVLIPTATGMVSLSRYALVLFPMFIAFSLWTRKSPDLERLALGGSASLMGLLTAMFASHYWVG